MNNQDQLTQLNRRSNRLATYLLAMEYYIVEVLPKRADTTEATETANKLSQTWVHIQRGEIAWLDLNWAQFELLHQALLAFKDRLTETGLSTEAIDDALKLIPVTTTARRAA